MGNDEQSSPNRSFDSERVSRWRRSSTAKAERPRSASRRFSLKKIIGATFRRSRPSSLASGRTASYNDETASYNDETATTPIVPIPSVTSQDTHPADDSSRRGVDHSRLDPFRISSIQSDLPAHTHSMVKLKSDLSSSPRTLRLSLIPTSIDKDQLRNYLASLTYEAQVSDDNILALSLAPYKKWLVATVTFRVEPLEFTECRSNHILDIQLPPQLSGALITVDTDFYGITPLYHPPQSEPKYDLIAVCGLSAHAFGSWKSHSPSYTMWLRDILPLDFPDFRVLTWGYESDLKDPIANRNITSFSRQLLMAIRGARELAMAKHRPIIFVGHSLGGLIIKQALVNAAEGNSPNDKEVLDSCLGMLFFGVPNRGLNNDNMLSLVKGMKSAPFVHDLMEGSEMLRILDYRFERTYEEHLKSRLVVSFYEMKDTNTIIETPGGGWSRTGKPIRMVSQDSATCFIRAKEVHHHIPIISDHSRLVKFCRRDDQNYLAVCLEINEILSFSDIQPLLRFAIESVQLSDVMQVLIKHDQEEYKSQIPALDPDDSHYYWITKNIDFKEWWEATGCRTLWISGPAQQDIRRISSYFVNAKRQTLGTAHSVLSFFCTAMVAKKPVWNVCVQALLYQILLSLPQETQKYEAIMVFLRQTAEALIERQSTPNVQTWKLNHYEFPNGVIGRMLDVLSDMELWDALLTILEIYSELEVVIIIDGLDQIQSQKGDCVKLLRSVVERSNVKALLTSAMDNEVDILLRGVPHIAYDVERKECLRILQFENTRYHKIIEEHEGTLEWLWSHEEYQKWSTSDVSQLLYIQGKPGSGKSTLTKYFKQHLIKRESGAKSAIIAGFFYSFREDESQKSHYNMLRCILYDIIQQDENFFYHAQLECRRYQSLLRAQNYNFGELYMSLQNILRSVGTHKRTKQLYIIIDAMDESTDEDRRNILQLMFELCTGNFCIVKVFIASRPVIELENLITEASHSIIRMQDVNKSDIRIFVGSFLAKDTRFPDNISSEISEYILEHSQGVFLWVHLVRIQLIGHYSEGWSRAGVFDFLKGLPKDLEEMYELILGNLAERDIGKQMFEWVLFACRPPTVLELQHALAIQSSPDISEESLNSNIIHGIERRIINCGGNLLECKGHEEPIVQVMHQTVREFFLRKNGPIANSALRMSEHIAHKRIATSCLRYLILCTMDTTIQMIPSNPETWNSEHLEAYVIHLNKRPLINYVLSHLQEHIHSCTEDNDLEPYFSQLCGRIIGSPTTYLVESWIAAHLCEHIRKPGLPSTDLKNNLLHVATQKRFPRVVEALLITGADTEACLHDKTPLMVSAEMGDKATARVLLNLKAFVGAKNEHNKTALHLAAANGDNSMVKLLLNQGAEVETADNKGQKPLHIAASNGHHTIVQQLVQTFNANIEAKDTHGRTALHVAAYNGHDHIVLLLVGKFGIGKEAKDHKGRTALHYAAASGHERTTELLTKKLTADSNDTDNKKWTALHVAAALGRNLVVRMLVNDPRVSTEVQNDEGKTALDLARFYCTLRDW